MGEGLIEEGDSGCPHAALVCCLVLFFLQLCMLGSARSQSCAPTALQSTAWHPSCSWASDTCCNCLPGVCRGAGGQGQLQQHQRHGAALHPAWAWQGLRAAGA